MGKRLDNYLGKFSIIDGEDSWVVEENFLVSSSKRAFDSARDHLKFLRERNAGCKVEFEGLYRQIYTRVKT